MTTISFIVHGQPQPAGSKKAFQWRARDGRSGTSVVDDNPKASSWKKVVAQIAREHYQGPLLEGPLAVEFIFCRVRPKAHFRTNGEVKPNAPAYPTTKPDALKLARGVEDALTGVIYRDDSQIVTERLCKRWGPSAYVEIVITEARYL